MSARRRVLSPTYLVKKKEASSPTHVTPTYPIAHHPLQRRCPPPGCHFLHRLAVQRAASPRPARARVAPRRKRARRFGRRALRRRRRSRRRRRAPAGLSKPLRAAFSRPPRKAFPSLCPRARTRAFQAPDGTCRFSPRRDRRASPRRALVGHAAPRRRRATRFAGARPSENVGLVAPPSTNAPPSKTQRLKNGVPATTIAAYACMAVTSRALANVSFVATARPPVLARLRRRRRRVVRGAARRARGLSRRRRGPRTPARAPSPCPPRADVPSAPQPSRTTERVIRTFSAYAPKHHEHRAGSSRRRLFATRRRRFRRRRGARASPTRRRSARARRRPRRRRRLRLRARGSRRPTNVARRLDAGTTRQPAATSDVALEPRVPRTRRRPPRRAAQVRTPAATARHRDARRAMSHGRSGRTRAAPLAPRFRAPRASSCDHSEQNERDEKICTGPQRSVRLRRTRRALKDAYRSYNRPARDRQGSFEGHSAARTTL